MSAAKKITFDDLPADLPVFPLASVIVLPRVNLPLNVFEPRYLAMTDHALRTDRLIGIVQSREGNMCKTGCAGKITSFQETADGRYLITLQGVCRFDIAQEYPLDPGGFRHVAPDWSRYRHDFNLDHSGDVCRDMISGLLRRYFEKIHIACDQWSQIRDMPCETLISTLSVICPFTSDEKQALLEAPDLKTRIHLMQSLLEIAIMQEGEGSISKCH